MCSWHGSKVSITQHLTKVTLHFISMTKTSSSLYKTKCYTHTHVYYIYVFLCVPSLQIDQNGPWNTGKGPQQHFSRPFKAKLNFRQKHICLQHRRILQVSSDNTMLQPDIRYTKVRWLLTIAGVFLYVGDIWTDIVLAVKYFQEEQYVWTGFTVMFILIGLLVTQIFSYAWYWDDLNDPLLNPEGKKEISDMSKPGLVVLHAFGFGIFTRYAIKITAFMRPQ